MFHFRKRDKDERKKEKDEKKKRDKKDRRISLDELRRLEDARQSLLGITRKKEKLPSGITADYMASFTRAEREALCSRGLWSATDDVPPRPPKRGILKSAAHIAYETVTTSPHDHGVVAQNTVRNEVINYERRIERRNSDAAGTVASSECSLASSASVQLLTRRFEDTPTTLSPSGSYRSSASSSDSSGAPSAGEAYGAAAPRLFPGLRLVLPAIDTTALPTPRQLHVRRRLGGEFGFALRRCPVSSAGGAAAVLFAEPAELGVDSDTPSLLPGDRLLEVNGVNVEHSEREQVVALIKNSGASVSLKVQPVPEMVEMSQRRSGVGLPVYVDGPEDQQQQDCSLRRSASILHANQTKTDDQLADEKAWLSTESVWLVHKDGFSAAQLLAEPSPSSSDGRVCVRLQASREVLEVDEDDVEKANPCSLDRLEDLSQLRHLNESSALHTLRQRFGSQLVHTAAGATTLIINPMAGLNLYSDKVVQLFRGFKSEDMPPHVYATAQSAYRALLSQRQDQSVVVLGRSGSGKTTCCRHLLHYLVSAPSSPAAAASASTRPLTVDRLRAVWTLLESFGNCRTVMNTNATRFTSIFSLDFDQFGQVASGSVQVLMLERDRVVKRPEGEPNFHIFYQLLAGADEALRQRLQLDESNEPNSFMTPLQRHADKQKAAVTWSLVQEAANRLDIQHAESEVLWSVLASIYHLGAAGVTKGPSGKYQFASALAARRAATLLGVRLEELARAVFSGDSMSSGSWSSTLPPAAAVRSTLSESPAERLLEGCDALNGFVAGLYAQLVSALVSLVNRCISTPAHTINSILVVDSAGFQNPASCGRQTGASFDDLCFNYVQERLQLLFHEHTFTNERQRYAQENIVLGCCELESADLSTPAPLVSALDQCPPVGAVLRCSQTERRGLFWLLDEAALLPDTSDAAFLHRVCRLYDTHAEKQLLRVGPGESCMTLQHFQGTNPVTYDVTGWVAAARETSASRRAATLLQESHRGPVSRMFVAARGNVSSGTLGGSVVGIEGSLSLRRAASIRRTFTTGTAGIKRNSRALLVKFQLDGIVEQLRRSRTRFVHCLLPQHTAGLCELKSPAATTGDKALPQDPHEILLNVPLLRSQFRGAQLLDALQLHKQGFPEHLSFAEFRRRFGLLAADLQPSAVSSGTAASGGDHRVALEHLLVNLDLDPLSYRLGLSQIFFRSGALLQLEERRDERLKDTVVRLQACCRAHLARRKFSQLKMEDVAARCVQRNVRKYLAVRSWTWWRLLVRIIPLLNVHRTEDQLKSANEELGKLRIRLEKSERERQEYKHDADKLGSKLSEITADLSEEHHTANLATGRLEAEQRERMRLEKQLQGVQGDFNRMCSMNEKLETELLYTRRSSELQESPAGSGGSEDEETPGSAVVYRRRFEYAARELEYTKKRMQQQHDDDVEQMMIVKKQLDKKAEAAYEEIDEQRQIVAQLKRKVSRLTGEASDQKIHLDEQTARNAVLEKRQRKFDMDMQLLEETLNKERAAVERTVREKDLLQGEIYSRHNELAAMRLELQMSDEKVTALRRDLDELEGPGGSEDELSALRRGRHELERRCRDQEEELDDLAGQVSMLEQAKLRLEMSLEQMRKENRHEAAQKDDEAEEFRANAHKKIKGLELQLETEHDERTALVREKHDLERRIIALSENTLTLDDQEAALRFKRDLKRTRALLKDAQLQLERARSESANKVQLRQLKNQLEDAEFAQAAAVRGRQAAESELQDLQVQLEEAQRVRAAAECRHLTSSREVHTLQSQVEEQDEELQEVMRKYKCAVAQLSADQQTLSDQCDQLAGLETERTTLREQLHELSGRLDALQEESGCRDDQRRLELRQRELQSRLDFEQTTKQRLESQLARLKEAVQKATGDAMQARQQEQLTADQLKKQQRQLRELKEDLANAERKECDAMSQVRALTKQLECSETEVSQSRTDLRLALKRIVDLQNAIQGDMDSEEASDSDSLTDSDEDDGEDLESFLSAHLPSSSGRENLSKVSSMSSAKLDVPSRTGNGEVSAAPSSCCGDPAKLNGRSQSDA